MPSRVVHAASRVDVAVLGCGTGGYAGGYGEGYTGYPATRTSHYESGAIPAKRAPEPLQGVEWVGIVQRPGTSGTHPPGPVGTPAGYLPGASSSKPRLLAIGARIDLISWKLSENGQVSPECVEKASVSPYMPKRVPKVTSWNSEIYISASLLSQGINGPF